MAESSEPKWRTGLFIVGSVMTILLTLTTVLTNAFGLWEKTQKDDDPAAVASGQPSAVPTAVPAPGQAGDTTAAALAGAEKQATAWLDALSRRDVDALVAMSEPPFFIEADYAAAENPLLTSKPAIRTQYEQVIYAVSDDDLAIAWQMDQIRPRTIGGLKDTGWRPDDNQFLGRVSLGDDDVVVTATVQTGQEILLFFRRSGADVALRGLSAFSQDSFGPDAALGDY